MAEGLRTAEEAVAYKAVETLFYVAIDDERTMQLLEQAAMQNIKLVCVNENVMKKIADTETPQGIIAEVFMRETGEFCPEPNEPILILDRIQDPGNMGTIIRTATATGFHTIVLIDSADAFSPKVIRSSSGGVFYLDIFRLSEE